VYHREGLVTKPLLGRQEMWVADPVFPACLSSSTGSKTFIDPQFQFWGNNDSNIIIIYLTPKA
jgi:hypothetical protein